MTKDKLDHYRRVLLEERARVAADRAAYAGDTTSTTVQDAAGDLSDYDPNDPADEAENLYDRDRELAAVENADRILAKIDRALAKIDDGTYGLSDIDGRPIPEERLEVMPYAVTTVDQESY